MKGFAERLRAIASRLGNRVHFDPRLRTHAGDALALFVLTCLFIAAYSMALQEPLGSDDCSYFEYASGKMAGAAHHRQRFVLLASTWFAQAAFGHTTTAYYAISFCYGWGLVLASYVLTRIFAGPLLSFVAAVMVLALPDFLENLTLLMPDVPGQFWLVLGLYGFLKFFGAEAQSRPWGWGLSSSFSFFCAASVKESLALTLLGLICFPLAFARSKEHWLRFACVSAGVAALEFVQTLVLWALFADPLYRVHAVGSGHVPQMEMYASTPGYMPEHIDWPHLATRFLDATSGDPAYAAGPGFGYWTLLVVSLPIALGAAIWRRDRVLLGFALFLLAAYATLTFTVVSLDPLIPVVRTIGRYFLVVLTLLPTFIIAGHAHLWRAACAAARTKSWRLCQSALLVVACLAYTSTAYASAAHFLTHSPRLIQNGAQRVRRIGQRVGAYVQKHPDVQRVLGPKLIRGGDFSWGLDVEVRGMTSEQLRRFDERRHDLVLDEVPALVLASPKLAWRHVGKTGAYEIVHVAELGDSLEAGDWELPALSEKRLRRAPRTRLSLRLEVRVDGVQLDPLELVAYGKRARKLERFAWTREGDTYGIDVESEPFRTSGLKACSLRFVAKGRGKFEILVREVSVASR